MVGEKRRRREVTEKDRKREKGANEYVCTYTRKTKRNEPNEPAELVASDLKDSRERRTIERKRGNYDCAREQAGR